VFNFINRGKCLAYLCTVTLAIIVKSNLIM